MNIEDNVLNNENFYIWGVPNRGEEVAKLIQDKGVEVCNIKDKGYANNNILIFNNHGKADFLYVESALVTLITSNWTELNLQYKPQDKELVWAWNDEECYKALGIYCLEWNSIYETKCRMCYYFNYKHYEGEWPQWAKDVLDKLEG